MERIIDKISFPSDWSRIKLSALGEIFKGKGISKSEILDKGIPCVRYGEIYTEYHYQFDSTISYISNESAKKSKEIKYGDVLFAGSGETPEDIGKAINYVSTKEAYSGGDIVIFRPKDTTDAPFLGYLLNSEYVNQQKFQVAQGHSVVHLYGKNIEELEVVLPSIDERVAIAEILSKWDELIEEQEKLIKAKEQQKKGLMQKLLTGELRFPGFYDAWVKSTLGEHTEIKTGKRDNQNKVAGGNYPFFVRSQTIERINSYSFDGEAILIPGEGKIGEIFHYINGKFDFHQRVYKICGFSEKLNGLFCKYFIQQHFKKEVAKHSVKATVDSLRLPTFIEMVIYLPELKEQLKIVSTLSFCDNEIEMLKEELERIKKQKKGLMQQLLTGNIRVKV